VLGKANEEPKMVEVDFISDRVTNKFHVDNIAELKRLVTAKADEDIPWDDYIIKVNTVEQSDTYVFKAADGPFEVRAVQKDIKGGL
jgi:hypothetical protein